MNAITTTTTTTIMRGGKGRSYRQQRWTVTQISKCGGIDLEIQRNDGRGRPKWSPKNIHTTGVEAKGCKE
jgi:hypothetical protein